MQGPVSAAAKQKQYQSSSSANLTIGSQKKQRNATPALPIGEKPISYHAVRLDVASHSAEADVGLQNFDERGNAAPLTPHRKCHEKAGNSLWR